MAAVDRNNHISKANCAPNARNILSLNKLDGCCQKSLQKKKMRKRLKKNSNLQRYETRRNYLTGIIWNIYSGCSCLECNKRIFCLISAAGNLVPAVCHFETVVFFALVVTA